MSDLRPDDSAAAASRRRVLVIAGIGVVALAIVVSVIVWSRANDDQPAAPTAGTPSPTAVMTATTAPASSATASGAASTPPVSVPPPTATGEPTVVPTAATSTTKAPIDKKGDLGNGVEVRVSKIESVQGVAQGPGEVAGPALRVSITVTNNTAKAVSMELALANLYYGKEATPASPLSGPGADPLSRPIKAGSSATGRYVFGVPKSERDHIQVEFSYTTDAPTVIFAGAA